MSCNCNSMRSPNPSNSKNVSVTINNNTNTDLYVDMSPGIPGPPNGVVPANSSASWTSSADNNMASLLWKDYAHSSGAIGLLAFILGGGVAVSCGGDSWVKLDGSVSCEDGSKDTFSQQGPSSTPWRSSCAGGDNYNIVLNFKGTLPL